MAEIRVEPKRRSMTWLWVVVLLLVLAAVAFFLLNRNGSLTTQTSSLSVHLQVASRALIGSGGLS